jgi:serine/threonine-protein phosphatase 4 catalytic subunit
VSQLNPVSRIGEIPSDGILSDMMWSDPNDNDVDGWSVSPRGAGYLFGPTPTEQFCHRNDFQLICRAHQLVMTGYKTMFNDKLVTVWSAPNYGYRCGNDASILQFDETLETNFLKFYPAPQDQRLEANKGKSTAPEYFL